jgi:hypothetical protein
VTVDGAYYQTRFEYDARRETLWRSLFQFYFHRWIRPEDCVLELGAGYGHFINNVVARRRIAVDIWTEMPSFVEQGVEPHVGSLTNRSFLENGSVDFAFASNLFEHLSQDNLVLASSISSNPNSRVVECYAYCNRITAMHTGNTSTTTRMSRSTHISRCAIFCAHMVTRL